MSDQIPKEKTAAADKCAFLAEIERLFFEGLSAQEIAETLGHKSAYCVGRNLRELKKRWARAAARQKSVLSQTQCATVYREAMGGWQRSQQAKVTTTEHRGKENEVDKTITRREEGPGDKTFLLAAVSALKALRQFAAEKDDSPPKPRQMTDREYLIYLEFLTQDQVDRLTDEQLQRMREAMDNLRVELDAMRREEERQREKQQNEDAGQETSSLP